MYTDIISIFSLNKNEKILKSNNIKKNLTKKIYSEYND